MRLLFCLVCGNQFNVADFDWLTNDEAARCRNCGNEADPLESLTLAEIRRIEKTYAIDTAQTVPVQGQFL